MEAQDSETSDDDASLARCLDGHPDAYRSLVERYQQPLVSWLTGRLRDRNTAEDVAQESFIRAWLALDRFQRGNPFFPWLCGIAHQVEREGWRSKRRRDLHHQAVQQRRQSPADPAGQTTEPDLALRAALDTLPENLRSIILLRYYGQSSCKEIAHRLGMPLGTVTKNLSRAHGLLREFLREPTRDPSPISPEVQS